jgi:hypothetical protein
MQTIFKQKTTVKVIANRRAIEVSRCIEIGQLVLSKNPFTAKEMTTDATIRITCAQVKYIFFFNHTQF